MKFKQAIYIVTTHLLRALDMKHIKIILLAFTCLFIPLGVQAQESQIKSLTFEGGPIATKHFQSGSENFRERHGLGIVKMHTQDYGNWALYYLGPNSVRDTSVGFGYVTNPYVIPFNQSKSIALELSGALGLVTGYQDYPVPLIAAQARLNLFKAENWDAGISAAIMPYIAEGQDKQGRDTGDTEFGIVGTTPFMSVRYNF